MAKDYIIFFDGLVEPVNPGGHGCYGYVIWRSKVKSSKRGYLGQYPEMTNNIAEWMAIYYALKEVSEDKKEDIESILILGDSKLIVNQLASRWQCKSEKMKELRDNCLSLLEGIGVPWHSHWIPRDLNDEADSLGREAYNLELTQVGMDEG